MRALSIRRTCTQYSVRSIRKFPTIESIAPSPGFSFAIDEHRRFRAACATVVGEQPFSGSMCVCVFMRICQPRWDTHTNLELNIISQSAHAHPTHSCERSTLGKCVVTVANKTSVYFMFNDAADVAVAAVALRAACRRSFVVVRHACVHRQMLECTFDWVRMKREPTDERRTRKGPSI